MESPTHAKHRAPSMSPGTHDGASESAKNGGSCTYVEAGSHEYAAPEGVDSPLQCSSPCQMREYSRANWSELALAATASRISSGVGQRSLRCTGPSAPSPSGSVDRSRSTRPASA